MSSGFSFQRVVFTRSFSFNIYTYVIQCEFYTLQVFCDLRPVEFVVLYLIRHSLDTLELLLVFSVLVYMLCLAIQPFKGCKSVQ